MQRGRHYRITLPNRSSATRSDSPSQARAFRGSISARLISDEFREPSIGRLGRALERLEIDVDHAEAAAVAFRPLEVINERPDEIAAQFRTGGERAAGGREVVAQIGDAVVVVYGAVRRKRISSSVSPPASIGQPIAVKRVPAGAAPNHAPNRLCGACVTYIGA